MSSRRKRQATRKQQPDRGRPPAWLMLVGGVAVGLVIALTAAHLLRPAAHSPHRVVTAAPPAAPAPHHPPPTRRTETHPDGGTDKPRFDFYTMLPKLKVFVPKPAPDTAAAPQTHGAEIDARGLYALQVGSFRRLEDANRVKARLALIGVEADVYTVMVNDERWHRLRVGPYRDLKKLRDITARLRKHNVNYMVLKMGG